MGLLMALALLAAACGGGSSDDAVDEVPVENDEETTVDANDTDGGSESADSGQSDTDDEVLPPEETAPRLTDSFTPLGEPGVGGRITSIAFDPDNPDRVFVGGDLLGIAVTDDFGETWQSTTGLASWEIADINTTATADGRIWTGSLSGPQSSTDGINWTLSRNGMPSLSENRYSLAIETVLVDPNDNSRLLAFNGNQRNWVAPGAIVDGAWDGDGSVWESTDSGQTWSEVAVINGNTRAAAFNADGTIIYAASADLGVQISSDGRDWGSPLPSATGDGLPHSNAYDITTHPTDPLVAWVAMGESQFPINDRFVSGGIWRTDDGGVTWTAANNGLNIVSNATAFNTGSFHQIVPAPSQPDRLFTSNVAPGQAAIYRSDDGGASWSVVADSDTPRPNAYDSALRAFDIGVHPSDADRIVIGSDDTLLGSTDGGATWTDITTTETEPGFYSGRGYSGLVSTDIVFNPNDPDDTIVLGFDGGNFIQTIDGGETWRRTVQDVSAWGGGVEAAYSPNDPDRLYVLLGQFQNFRGIGVSTNGGESFSLSVGANSGLPEVGNVDGGATGLAVLDSAGTDLVFAVVGRTLYRSDDNAQTFTASTNIAGVRDVATGPSGNVFVSTQQGAFVSTDGGLNFAPAGAAPAGIGTLYTSGSESGTVYGVAFREGDGGVYRFDGNDWSLIFDDFFSHGVAIDPSNPDNLAIVTTEQPFNDISSATGVHLSNNGGQTWTAITEGLPLNRLRTAEFDPADPDRLVVGTTGRGFYEISFNAALGNG